ncbi:EAL domain-containing protein [Marinobacteraceae bacterium S3BR75-40.1]
MMWSFRGVAVAILILLVVANTYAQTLTLGDQDVYSLNDQLAYVEDSSKALTLQQVIQSDQWQQKRDADTLNLGFTDSVVWLKTSIRIPERTDQPWYLVIPYPLLEEAELYVLRDGSLPAVYQTSRAKAMEGRPHAQSYQVTLPLPRDISGTLDLVLRANSSTSLQVPLELWRQDYLLDQFAQESLYWGVYFGLLGALVIYNLFLFLSIRDPAYGYYVLYLIALSLLMLCLSGVGQAFVWAEAVSTTRYVLSSSTGFVSLWALLFARSFLKWRGFPARLDRSMRVTALLAAVLIVMTPFFPIYGALLSGLLGGLVITLLITAGLASLVAGVPIARYFVLAWTALATGVALYLLNIFDLLPVNIFTNHGIVVGSAAEVLLLSFALAHRIKEERAHKIAALERQQQAERRVRRLELETLERAMHDSVTRLPNTSLLNHRLRELLAKDCHVAVVLVHYPQVKDIASSMGHSLAETVFLQLAQKLNHVLSGPEALVCLEGKGPAYVAIPEFGSAAFLVDLNRLDKPLTPFIESMAGQHEISVNAVRLPLLMMHCGVAQYPENGETPEVLFQHALAAMESSMRSKVPVQIYNDDISAFARRRLALMSALPPAIEEGELELYLQPQMSQTGQDLVGAEVLLRWNSAKFGPVPAWEVIDIAENAGLMDLLSRFVVREALKTLARLEEWGLPITCSINLSVKNLTDTHFVTDMLADARRQGVAMDRLVFEVTETAMMQNMDVVIGSLLMIADGGSKVALDDFGTGYSSLAYLSRLPIHELKIDRCFISQMNANRNDLWIVENTLKLAETLQLETVAEGVEDSATLELLTQLGCHRVQGYQFARPMPVDRFYEWAMERKAG